MNELEMARTMAEWLRRYDAAQATIAELQAERDELQRKTESQRKALKIWDMIDSMVYNARVQERDDARRSAAAWKAAAKQNRREMLDLEPRIAELERHDEQGDTFTTRIVNKIAQWGLRK